MSPALSKAVKALLVKVRCTFEPVLPVGVKSKVAPPLTLNLVVLVASEATVTESVLPPDWIVQPDVILMESIVMTKLSPLTYAYVSARRFTENHTTITESIR